jgi:hypothetical protein
MSDERNEKRKRKEIAEEFDSKWIFNRDKVNRPPDRIPDAQDKFEVQMSLLCDECHMIMNDYNWERFLVEGYRICVRIFTTERRKR